MFGSRGRLVFLECGGILPAPLQPVRLRDVCLHAIFDCTFFEEGDGGTGLARSIAVGGKQPPAHTVFDGNCSLESERWRALCRARNGRSPNWDWWRGDGMWVMAGARVPRRGAVDLRGAAGERVSAPA